jgi:phospholipid/cholesterol/gamma-HCH transport system substrate-binding protein
MSSAKSAAVKVGIFTLLSLTILGGVIYWLQGRRMKQGPTYTVSFPDVDGLNEGAPVQILGTRVGFVEDIKPVLEGDAYKVDVRFRLTDEKRPIPKASVLSIEQSGLISEKLLEITPPHLSYADVESALDSVQEETMPLELRMEEGWVPIGRVERIEKLKALPASPLNTKKGFKGYRFYYRLLRPGVLLPDVPFFFASTEAGETRLRVDSYDPDWRPPNLPDAKLHFTVEPPLRLKEFLEIQIASAEALKETNDKINALLDAETIGYIQTIVKNIKTLSGQTTELIDSTQRLIKTIDADIQSIVSTFNQLSISVNRLVGNINGLLEDPALKNDVKGLVVELRQTVLQAQALMEDPELKSLLVNANVAVGNVNRVATLAEAKLQSETITAKMETTLAELNRLLVKANALTEDGTESGVNKAKIQQLVNDATVTVNNFKEFSKKLRGHFVLWKLAF